MVRLLALPLLLALASCGTGRGVSTARAEAPIETILTQPVNVDPGVLGPFPLDGAFVYEADPVCLDSGIGVTIPNLTTAICMRAKSIEYIRKEVQAGRIIPGSRFTACTYFGDPNWPNCIAFALAKVTPEIRFGVTPRYVNGSIGGVPYSGCAAGIAFERYIRVSIADLPRSYLLASWEAANSILFYHLDRRDLADGYVVSAATNYAAQACGVQ